MDTTAGICLRPSASMLCRLNDGNPLVAARSKGYRSDLPADPAPPPEPERPRGLAALFGRRQTTKPAEAANPNAFPFDRAGELLLELKIAASETGLTRVAVAVPCWANDTQRKRVADGARAAHWDLLGLVNEPTAAAMASGALGTGDGNALVYDLAEGRFDVTIVAFKDLTFEVLASDGLVLSGDTPPLPDYLPQTGSPCQRALQYAGLKPERLDTIVLVGEMARDQATYDFVTALFGQPPLERFDPEEIIGVGAAVHASILDARKR